MNIVLTELYELNTPKPARARRTDSNTSHEAAERTEAATVTHWQRMAIKSAVMLLRGATAKEIAKLTGVDYITTQRRMSEVEGLYKTDDERDGCRVWRCHNA